METILTNVGGALHALRQDLPFLIVIGGFTAVVLALYVTTGFPARLDLTIPWWTILTGPAVYLLAAGVFLLVRTVIVEARSLRQASTWATVAHRLFPPGPSIAFLLILILFPFWIRTFIAVKAAIPAIQPFAWDVEFMYWDELVHFGRHPWALLQPLLGRPAVTWAIDAAYTGWFTVLWLTFIWQAWHGSREEPTRLQFLLSFGLCWIILGIAAAAIFSSAGPVFFGLVTDTPDPYVPLMNYLHGVDESRPLNALRLHGLLWSAYADPSLPPQGIAAMPSVHVAVATLMVLVGFRTHPAVGILYLCYALVIFLGSIHLAWHYAIDGYAGTLGALVIWAASGRFSRWWTYRTSRRQTANPSRDPRRA